jgi:hypothetical protein
MYTPTSRDAPDGKSKRMSHAIRMPVITPKMSVIPLKERSGRKKPNLPPVMAAAIPQAPVIAKKTSHVLRACQPSWVTPAASLHDVNSDAMSRTPPTPASSRPNAGLIVLIPLLSSKPPG